MARLTEDDVEVLSKRAVWQALELAAQYTEIFTQEEIRVLNAAGIICYRLAEEEPDIFRNPENDGVVH